ncbi:hypothetical protein M404DRAFT_935846 [Pisolithus tinctorius Marx 270]|uniref:Uncharacterized protein n=1 Tax=Pisolithus tinctorius Marx 270 TaxID=870435 RepID=A0A0C3N2G0_PISTI|nr:hypothetical protein M404DRAFT_935846 [Pisolithus tinctorius Marx 270]
MANQGEVPLEWVLECAVRFGILLQELESAQQAATGHDSLPVSYIRPVDVLHTRRPGRPHKQPNIAILQAAMSSGHHIPLSKLSHALGIHQHTLHYYMQKFGIDYQHTPISNSELDTLIQQFRASHPQSGLLSCPNALWHMDGHHKLVH